MLEMTVKKQLRDFPLEVSFSVEPGKILVLMGANGSGKSTTLNIIAGLLQPDTGSIRLNNTTLCDPELGICIPVEERRIGYVFQSSAVFPHMTVTENIAYGLKAWGLPRGEIAERVDQMIALMHLEDLRHIRAGDLSGGQKQRVALGRAIAIRPSLLMMDEPFTSLDAESSCTVKDLTRTVVDEYRIPCIIVSHNVTDSREIGDRVFLLRSGKQEWTGRPQDIPDDAAVCHCREIR